MLGPRTAPVTPLGAVGTGRWPGCPGELDRIRHRDSDRLSDDAMRVWTHAAELIPELLIPTHPRPYLQPCRPRQ